MAFKYIGTSSTIITDGGVENPTINGVVVTTKNEGDIVFYTDKRFLWTSNAWKYQGDINTHTDVQDALNAIAEAYKGEEVRGSIYDAIALIDTRSTAMEDAVGSKADEITNDALNVHYPLFEIDSDTWKGTCSISGSEMQHLIQYKEAIEPILKVGNNAILHSSTTTANIGTNGPIVKCYYVAPNASNLICYEIHMEYGASKNVTCTRTLTPISGGGGSYTEGDGIDITNDEISIKLRSSNPGLAFDSNGNLYATGGGGGGSYTEGDGIDITDNVISIGEPVYITMTEGANGIVDTSFIVSITEANFLAKFGIGAKDLMTILSGPYNVAKLGIKVLDDTSTSMDAYLDKIPILDIRYSKYDEELSLSEAATMIFIWDHCVYEFVINVEYSDEFRGTVSKINGYIAKTKATSNGYGITGSGNSISVDTSVIQKKLTSANAGTGISIANDGQGNPVISLELPQAEGGGF